MSGNTPGGDWKFDWIKIKDYKKMYCLRRRMAFGFQQEIKAL
jgi:hypothetical protein